MLAAILLGTVWYALPVQAQFSRVWSAEEVQAGQTTNLFVQWDGRTALDGMLVEVPAGWTLKDGQALRWGYDPVPLTVQHGEASGNLFEVTAARRLDKAYEVVLRFETGGAPGRAVCTLTPFIYRSQGEGLPPRRVTRDAYRVEQPMRQVAAIPALDNQVLAFRPGEMPWLLRRTAVPDLSPQANYTVEFWLRTTDLNEVVVSTWDGREQSSYPIELMVDNGGRLRFYRGQPGQHESMATPSPVADGQWHHIALTHEAAAGWTRLFFDGQAADSLYNPVLPAIEYRTALALGGRLPAQGDAVAPTGSYTGLIDELRLWPMVRRPATLRRSMRQLLRAEGTGAVLLGFEEEIPERLVERDTPRTERITSDLAFYRPVQGFQATLESDVVHLTWHTDDPHTTSFVVERSWDGHAFEPIGTVDVVRDKRGAFSFLDPETTDQVVFYRVRQRFESGAERVSSAIKLGMAAKEQPAVVLVGNFPNPFNPTTTVTYEVQRASPIRLSVWDLSGQQVAVLVDRIQQPGAYQVRFEGSDLPSGTYFIRLENESGTQTHKMILMK